ncbi:MAG: hypothetical protein LAP40_19620 [Acidobacteriia bacterium]|nr:hypothetical protein [Terriglobia bacterium]
MPRKRRIGQAGAAWAIVVYMAAPLGAQWLKIPSPGIPRTADGKPNLTAPAPRGQDGKPDLSGIWQQPNGVKYTVNLAADLKPGDVPMQPWAAEVYKHRQDTLSKEDPVGTCHLPGVPQMNAVPYPYKILQYRGEITILYEAFATFRQIFTDGRALPDDPNPTWMGYSVGKWDGDTLVVQSAGFNDQTWLDTGGHPHTEALRVTERFHRRDFGHIDLKTTIDDPKAYTRPWTVTYELRLMPDTELLEYLCTENNRDTQHLVGK